MKQKSWQSHHGTNIAHYFPNKKPGEPSLCGRATATTGEYHSGDVAMFICAFCRKKLTAAKDQGF